MTTNRRSLTQQTSARACARFASISRRVLLGLALAAASVTVTESSAFAQGGGNQGLVGLLPDEAPYELTEDGMETLVGKWAPVRTKIAGLVEQLHNDDTLNIVGQRRVIEDLKGQVRLLRAGMSQPRNKPILRGLVELHGRLSRRVGLAEAILDAVTISTKPTPTKPSGPLPRQRLAASVGTLHKYLKSFDTGSTWIGYLGIPDVEAAAAKEKPTARDVDVLKAVHKRLVEKNKLEDPAQVNFLGEPQFAAVEKNLGVYLAELSKPRKPSAAPPKPLDDKTRQSLRPHLATLAESIDRFEETASKAAATRARQALQDINKLSPTQYEQLGEALRSHYLGYNLRVVASERLLSRYVSQTRVKKKAVNEVILEAKVTGDSTTTAKVGIDLVPSQDGARFRMVLKGQTITDTRADKSGASIFTHGEHDFNATKLVQFDGDKFTTRPAEVSVDPNNTIVDVRARSSLVKRLARKKAMKLAPRSTRIAGEKVAADVAPEFNGEVDKQFQKATADLTRHVNGPLKELGLEPSGRSVTSTDQELRVSSQLMGSGELAAGLPNPSIRTSRGVVVHLHESAINNALDRMKLSGRTMTEQQLKAEFEKTMSTFVGSEFRFEPEAKTEKDTGPTTLVFANDDPVRVRIADGQLVLIIRAGLKQEAGKEDIPAQVVTVPFDLGVEGDNVSVARGSVKVSAVSRPKNRAKQIVRAGVVRKKLTSGLTDRAFDRHMSIPREGADPMKLSVIRVEAADGWLSVVFE